MVIFAFVCHLIVPLSLRPAKRLFGLGWNWFGVCKSLWKDEKKPVVFSGDSYSDESRLSAIGCHSPHQSPLWTSGNLQTCNSNFVYKGGSPNSVSSCACGGYLWHLGVSSLCVSSKKRQFPQFCSGGCGIGFLSICL